ncbi:uncharacterized protein [Periplaneta americana]|uniref:uncharacterized protein n=1 Tax=Periplaneta americana TaxID=6978 RepID=UPI0037E7C14D
MAERKETALERLTLNDVKDVVLGMLPEPPSVPVSYPHQDIIVEVPLINGEPPATLNSTGDEISNPQEYEKVFEMTSKGRPDICEEVTTEQFKEESSPEALNRKEEQIRKRREQNRFRMRALRASESEVAQRLRERNKFRMRTLRASDSLVAQSLRERNKFRMRERRSSETRLPQGLPNSSDFHARDIQGSDCISSSEIKIEPCSEQTQEINSAAFSDDTWKRGLRMDVINVCAEGSKLPWVLPVQNRSAEEDLAHQYVKEDKCENETDCKERSLCWNLQCASINRYGHCKYKTHFLSVEIEGKQSETSAFSCVDGGVNCVNCKGFIVKNSEVGTYMTNVNQQHKQFCTCHVMKNDTNDLERPNSGHVNDFQRLDVTQEALQPRESCVSHFMMVDDKTDYKKRLMHEVCVSDIQNQAEQRKEKGKLRMRLKRHSETEEEAERRRERGRLRMRVLRASETEEQAARRRELNRLRMRMKRNSARQ